MIIIILCLCCCSQWMIPREMHEMRLVSSIRNQKKNNNRNVCATAWIIWFMLCRHRHFVITAANHGLVIKFHKETAILSAYNSLAFINFMKNCDATILIRNVRKKTHVRSLDRMVILCSASSEMVFLLLTHRFICIVIGCVVCDWCVSNSCPIAVWPLSMWNKNGF